MPQYPALIGLADLDGSDGFALTGVALGDNSGYSVSGAGDVNGDGFDDIIVGAPLSNANGFHAGASYVVFGTDTGFAALFDLAGLDGDNGFRILGEFEYDRSGRSVSYAGDVNGDGFADVIVGSPDASPHGGYSGASYVVFGKEDGFPADIDLGDLDGDDGFQISGELLADDSGFSVSAAGDMNNDGFGDVIVGAFGSDGGGDASGAAYVVFGTGSGFAATVELSGLDGNNGFQINGANQDDLAGWSVSSAGDVNGDDFDDIVLGAKTAGPSGHSSGAAYLVFGRASGFDAVLDLAGIDGINGLRISGAATLDEAGISVSGAGDFNADGFADLIVGADAADPNGLTSGAAYVLFGTDQNAGANVNLSALNGNHGFRINGEAAGDAAGYSVSNAGDFNGDGFDDVIVGAWHANANGGNSGASYVVFGSVANFGASFELSSLDGNNGFKIAGADEGDASGISVSAAGDVNGDGFADLIIGAPDADVGDNYGAGTSYVIFGGMPGEAVDRTGTNIANTIHGGNFDDTLSGLGGADTLLGHDGKDTIRGGKGDDAIIGGAGRDGLDGGGGADVFVFEAVSDSTSVGADIVARFNFSVDKFDANSVAAIDTAIESGALNKATLDADLAAAVDAAHLGAGNAVIFTPDAGDLAGKVVLVIDVNGAAGYQAGEDLVIELLNAKNLGALGTEDFI